MFYITAIKHFQCRSCKCRIDRGNIYYTSKHAHTHHQGVQRQSNAQLQSWIRSQEFNSCFATLPPYLKIQLNVELWYSNSGGRIILERDSQVLSCAWISVVKPQLNPSLFKLISWNLKCMLQLIYDLSYF